MSTKSSLILTSVDPNGKTLQKALTYVNSSANKNTAVDFARGLNAMTNNTLHGVELVTKEDILSEYDATDPQFTIEVAEIPYETWSPYEGFKITIAANYKGSARQITFSGKKEADSRLTYFSESRQIRVTRQSGGIPPTQTPGSNAVVTLTLAAGDGYKAATTTLTFLDVVPVNVQDV